MQISKSPLIALLVSVTCLVAGSAQADSGNADTNNPASGNYEKAEKLLPGEEVVTPTGQKMKVWSTEGPVNVDRAPEPFEDPNDQIGDVDVVIDGRRIGRDIGRDVNPPRREGPGPRSHLGDRGAE